jgi:hypothetical protein
MNGAATQRAVWTHDHCRAVHLIVLERAVVDAVTHQVTVDTHACPQTPVVARTGKVLHRNVLIFSPRAVAFPVVQQGCRDTQTICACKEPFRARVVVVAVVSCVCGGACGIHVRRGHRKHGAVQKQPFFPLALPVLRNETVACLLIYAGIINDHIINAGKERTFSLPLALMVVTNDCFQVPDVRAASPPSRADEFTVHPLEERTVRA